MSLPLTSRRVAAFWAKVDKEGPVVRPELGPCWVWTAAQYRAGYGHALFGAVEISAHRAAWVLAFGDFDRALEVCHKCDNPPCVNPAHLFLGTQKENSRDMSRKGRSAMPRGAKNCNARFTDDLVRTIRRQALALSYDDLATIYRVHVSTISRLVRGLSWSHVGGAIDAQRESIEVA